LPVVAEIVDHPFNTTVLFVKHQGNNDAGVRDRDMSAKTSEQNGGFYRQPLTRRSEGLRRCFKFGCRNITSRYIHG
jgi:hypothetical protein